MPRTNRQTVEIPSAAQAIEERDRMRAEYVQRLKCGPGWRRRTDEPRPPAKAVEPAAPEPLPPTKTRDDTALGRAMARVDALFLSKDYRAATAADVLGYFAVVHEKEYGFIPGELESKRGWDRALKQATSIVSSFKDVTYAVELVRLAFKRHQNSKKGQAGERAGWGLVHWFWKEETFEKYLPKNEMLPSLDPQDIPAEPIATESAPTQSEPDTDVQKWRVLDATTAIRNSTLTPTQTLVLLVLVLEANNATGIASIKQKTLAEKTRLALRTVNSAMLELVALSEAGKCPIRIVRKRQYEVKNGHTVRIEDEICLGIDKRRTCTYRIPISANDDVGKCK